MTNSEYIKLLSKSTASELFEDREAFVRSINQTISEIAIGELTDTGYLFEQENNPAYENAYEEVDNINEALRLKGFKIKDTKYIDLAELLKELRS